MKYKNFYSVSRNNAPNNSDSDDKEEESLYKEFAHKNQNSVNLQHKYECDRANRQMSHFFDTLKYTTATKKEEAKVTKPTKTQIEYWKMKKEEKTKKKKEWLYE